VETENESHILKWRRVRVLSVCLLLVAVVELWYYCAYHDVCVRGEDMVHNYVVIVVSYHFETHNKS
jgi:hypothetical protein